MYMGTLEGESKLIKQKGDPMMNMDKDFPVANLAESQLEQIESLENELRKQTNENIVLIAYDEKNEGK